MKNLSFALVFSSFFSVQALADNCLARINGIGMNGDVLKVTVSLLEEKTSGSEDDRRVDPYLVSRKLSLKVCSFSTNKGHIPSEACDSYQNFLIKATGMVKIKVADKKSCASLKKGDWIRGVKTDLDEDV